MLTHCVRCPAPASSVMTFDYEQRAVWLEEWEAEGDGRLYPLCMAHADRLSPPYGWTLTDRRNVRRLFSPGASSEVA